MSSSVPTLAIDLREHQEIRRDSPAYPPVLKDISHPPERLFCLGDLSTLSRPAIAIVGSRNASRYGVRLAENLAYDLAVAGFAVVSGFARGIDTAAHRGAIRAGGKTIAVLGCGLGVNYPKSNGALRDAVSRQGVLVSEFETYDPPFPSNFPRRNRIIAGLSAGLVVVEARAHSGSLITARQALEAGREVFAMPGPVTAGAFEGCHTLLKEGAPLVESAEDVISNLPDWVLAEAALVNPPSLPVLEAPKPRSRVDPKLSETEQGIVDWMGEEPLSIDRIARGLLMPPVELMRILGQLELKGRIAREGAIYRVQY